MKIYSQIYEKMKANISKFAFLAIIILAASACSPDQFKLHRGSPDEIRGLIMTPYGSVDVYQYENRIEMGEHAALAMRSDPMTQYEADITTILKNGSGVRFAFRTVCNEYANRPSMALEFTTSGCRIIERGEIIRTVDSVKALPNKPYRVKIKNEGDLVKVRIDCDDIYIGTSELPATEYIIVETIGKSEAELKAIHFYDCFEGIEIYDIVEPAKED